MGPRQPTEPGVGNHEESVAPGEKKEEEEREEEHVLREHPHATWTLNNYVVIFTFFLNNICTLANFSEAKPDVYHRYRREESHQDQDQVVGLQLVEQGDRVAFSAGRDDGHDAVNGVHYIYGY